MLNLLEKLQEMTEDRVGILDHAGRCGCSPAEAVASVVGHKKVQPLVCVEWSDEIVVAHNFPVAMKKKDIGAPFLGIIEPATHGDI